MRHFKPVWLGNRPYRSPVWYALFLPTCRDPDLSGRAYTVRLETAPTGGAKVSKVSIYLYNSP